MALPRFIVRPENPDIDFFSRQLVRSRNEQLPFPPPQLVGEVYDTLRGSGQKDRFPGYGSLALPGRVKDSNPPEGKTLIPACVAWCLASRGDITDSQTKRGLTNLLTQHSVLGSESSHEQLWRDVGKRSTAMQAVKKTILEGHLQVCAHPRDKYF